MTTTSHRRSMHIDAPPQEVFHYIEDPRHFLGAFPGAERNTVTEIAPAVDGAGSTYAWRSPVGGFRLAGARFSGTMEAVMTREEYVPGERIVDHSSTGPVWTLTVEPDTTGSTLSLAFDWTTRVPMADKVLDRVLWHGERDMDEMLARIKQAVEG